MTEREMFEAAIHSKGMIRLCFMSREDGRVIERLCAPMDYGPSRRARDGKDRYHLWDYDSDKGAHTLGILPESVREMEVLAERFEPGDFVTWSPKWFIARDWGVYS